MVESIAAAVIELARFALYGYAVKNARDVIVHWLDHGRPLLKASAEEQILDTARTSGIDLGALARRATE